MSIVLYWGSSTGWQLRRKPNMAFDICELNVSIPRDTVSEILKLNNVVGWVKADPIRISFPKMKSLAECHLECSADASFANLQGHMLQGSFIIFLSDSSQERCPIF